MLFSNTLVGLHEISILVFYYCLGGVTKKYNLVSKILMRRAMALLFLLLLITLLWIIVTSKYNDTLSALLLRYDLPSIILISMCFVVIFAKIQVAERMKKLISMVASSTFAVYLLNDHPLVKTHLIRNRFAFLQNQSVLELLLCVVGGSILFLFVSILIDKARELIFLSAVLKSLLRKLKRCIFGCALGVEQFWKNIYDKLMKE